MRKIIVDGRPKTKKNTWFTSRGKGKGHAFRPPTGARSFETKISKKAAETFDKPLSGPIRLKVKFLFHRPKRLKDGPEEYAPKRPDITNIIKAIEDGLNGVAFLDDAQVVSMTAEKYYHSSEDTEKTIIEIGEII